MKKLLLLALTTLAVQAQFLLDPYRFATASSGSSLDDDLIVYWTMDEASGNRADSWTNAVTLTDVNTVTSAAGQISNAAVFTAANQESFTVAVGDPKISFLQFYEPGGFTWKTRTMCFWVYFVTTTDQNLVSCGNGLSLQQYGSQLISQRITFYVAPSLNPNVTVTASTPAIVAANWYWVRMWIDSTSPSINIQVYDLTNDTFGSVYTTSISGVASHNTATDFYIGRFWNSVAFNLNGRLDEFAIWGRLLTNDERDYLITPARPDLTP